MFETVGSREEEAASSDGARVADISTWLRRLAGEGVGADDAGLVDEIEMLERLKSAAAARQARLSTVFADSQRAAQRAAGVRSSEVGRGVAGQVGLARHDSAHKGARHLGLAETLVGEMPATLAAL
ncbi:MAG: hypothetical protein ACRDQA_02260, partial [Nocardioidaceae bacterium]